MKKLQNNFTTPEQSKILLGLGVPADSADLYFDKDEAYIDERIQPYFIPLNRTFRNYDDRFYIPCWSLGRLFEIYNICFNHPRFGRYENMIHTMVDAFVFLQGFLDFSKLEK